MEEETMFGYNPDNYYPVKQGEILNNRYQIIGKIGYGTTSTVWLAKDLTASEYVTVKIFVTVRNRKHERELDIYQHINSVKAEHTGRHFIRSLLDNFEIVGPHGRHTCLVHEPLRSSLAVLLDLAELQLDTEYLKPAMLHLLLALHFLHTECQVIHADIQLKNLLLPEPETSKLSRFEEGEVKTPAPRKVLKDRTIYKTMSFFPEMGFPLLADFGEARLGNKENNDDIMPTPYRAPEVILRSNWDYKVDIWSVAMVAWQIVSPRRLIDGTNADGYFDDRVHMAELIALLGPPPPEFREQRPLSSAFWNESGNWRKELGPIPDITLESLAEDIKGEDKGEFLRWLRRALQWNPEDRATAEDLLLDEWLMKGMNIEGVKEGEEPMQEESQLSRG